MTHQIQCLNFFFFFVSKLISVFDDLSTATKRQVVPNSGRQVKDNTSSSKKRAASKRAGDSSLDLRKVSTARGMSFAPEEFAFSAPNNLASFVFKPLSPASSENFLFSNNPDETAAFVATDVGRYSLKTDSLICFTHEICLLLSC